MPCDYKKYDMNWKNIRKVILQRADNKCELCNADNYKSHWKTKSRVILKEKYIEHVLYVRNHIMQLRRI